MAKQNYDGIYCLWSANCWVIFCAIRTAADFDNYATDDEDQRPGALNLKLLRKPNLSKSFDYLEHELISKQDSSASLSSANRFAFVFVSSFVK